MKGLSSLCAKLAQASLFTPDALRDSLTYIFYNITSNSNRQAAQGEHLNVWNGGAKVLIWGLQFGVGEIIWVVKF